MKSRLPFIFAATLAIPTVLQAATFTWTGTTSGDWGGGASNWNGVAPTFNNTTDLIFDGSTPITTYGTFLGTNRIVRSLTFSNLASQLEIRPNNNGTTARQLQFAANSGNATITVDATVTAPIIIGALAGDGTNNGTNRLDSNLDVFQNSSFLLTIRRPINQSGGNWGINKYGTGPLRIGGDGGYTGDVNITAGTLQISSSGGLGTAPKNVGISSGATFETLGNFNPGSGYSVTVSGSGVGGVGAIYRSSGSNNLADVFTDGITLAGPTTVGAAAGARFGVGGNNGTGTTSGPHTLTKVGAGQFDLRGSITIGNVVVQEGFFQTQASVWNDDGFTISCSPGTEFHLFNIGSTFPRDIILDNSGINSSGSADLTGDTLSGNISLTGANTITSGGDELDSLVLAGDLSETAPGASVTIAGARKVVLAGGGTYTGDTFVGNGTDTPTLQLDGTLTSDIIVADLATLGGDGVTTGSVTLAPLANLSFDPSTTGPNEFLRASDVIVGVSDLIHVVPSNPGSGTPTVVLRDGNGGLNLSNFTLPDAGRATLSLGGAGGNSDLIFNPNTANLEWRNFSANGLWAIEDLSDNFQNLGTSSPDDFYINDNVSFTNAAVGTVTLAADITAGSVTFGNTVGNDIQIVPSFLETLQAASISTTSTGDVTISADIVGATEVISNGTGTLILEGINTAVAPMTINSGTVQIGSGGSIGSVASPIVNNGALVINRGDAVNLSQVISGTGPLTQVGSGTTQLSAAHTYNGLTTVSAGTLELTATGSIPGNILNDSILLFSGNTDKTHAGDISGTGTLRKSGTHFLTLTGTNSFSGGIVIEDGVIVSTPSNTGSGSVTMAGNSNFCRWFALAGTHSNDIVFENGASGVKIILTEGASHVTLTGTVHLDDDEGTVGNSRIGSGEGTIVIAGKMTGTGTGGYAKRNNGTVVISSTENDYTGPTTIAESGTLIVDGKVPGNVFFGTNLTGTGTGTTSGTLAGSGLISGNVTTRADSNLSPGGSSNAGVNTATAATLSIGGNLNISLSAGGAGLIFADLDSPGGTNDQIVVGGQAIIGNETLGLSDFSFNNLGGLAAGSYTLISATGGFDGLLNPSDTSGEIAPGLTGSLAIVGNDLVLTTSTGNAYDTWIGTYGLAGPDAAFDFDYDLDGIDNGLEWILGGDPTTGDASSLYTVTGNATTGLTLSFTREEDSIGVANLTVEYGTDLASFPKSTVIGATSAPADGNGTTVTINDVPSPDEVTVAIPASNAFGGKLFARLKALLP